MQQVWLISLTRTPIHRNNTIASVQLAMLITAKYLTLYPIWSYLINLPPTLAMQHDIPSKSAKALASNKTW